MKELTYLEAINEALHEEMARDERVFAMGEDVAAGYMRGGIFGATRNLLERFGPERVYDTPISESGICGCAVGAALMGYRPIVELMFGDFLTLAMAYGLTAAILDPTDKRFLASILTTRMLLGQDEYCANFIDAYQSAAISDT